MGYYGGNGVVSGGGEQVSQFGSLVYNGAHIVYQKTVSTVTKKAGVSLATAQAAHGACTLKSSTFSFANLYPFVGCRGTKTDVSYSQIADSNLYELDVTESTMSAKGDDGNWIGPND